MKKMKIMIALVMTAAMVFTMAACGNKAAEKPAEEPEKQEEPVEENMVELSEDQMDDLYQQAAEKTLEARFSDYMPDKVVGHGEAFNISRDGDKGTWDVLLVTGEYAALDDKAYEIAGSYGEAILKFDYTQDGPKLNEVIWSADGGEHDKWIEENFSEEGLKNWKTFQKDEKNRKMLVDILDKKAETALGVPVEQENILEIDEEKGTYQVTKITETGDPGKDDYNMETETLKEGKLEDLKK